MFPTLPVASTGQTIFKRAQLGLFGGKVKQFGNNVPNSKHKTLRTWLPNIQTKHLYSEALDARVTLKITTRALRTIDKYGGLDPYILGVKDTTLGHEGMRLRIMIREARERRQTGLPVITSTEKGKMTLNV